MKNLLSSSAILAALCAGTTAQAEDDWYASVFAGYSIIGTIDTDFYSDFVEHNFEDSYILGGTVGRSIGQNLRAEVELSYSSYTAGDVFYNGSFSDLTTGDASVLFLLGNVWYDLPDMGGPNVVPYVGGGLGAAYIDADTRFGGNAFGYGGGNTGFAAQVGFGARFEFGTGSVDVGYRLKGSQGADIADADGDGTYENARFMSHTLQVGYVFDF